jgi:hypothetical protein
VIPSRRAFCRPRSLAYEYVQTFTEREADVAPRRIFVPHVHEDDGHVDKLRDLLNAHGREADVSAIDSSTPNDAHDPDYIMSKYIRPKVEWCEAIVVLISPNTQGHDWVDKEIALARQLDRRVVGVWIPGSEGCSIPEGLQDYSNAIVEWNEDRILAAIDGAINDTSDATGRRIAPQDIKRHNC